MIKLSTNDDTGEEYGEKSTKKKKSFFDSWKEFEEYESMPTIEEDEKNCDLVNTSDSDSQE